MIILIKKKELPEIGEYKYYDFPNLKNELIIYNKNNKYMVYSSFCPHFGGILKINNDKLHCHFHDYKYDLETGNCLNREFGSKCQKFEYFEDIDGLSIEIL